VVSRSRSTIDCDGSGRLRHGLDGADDIKEFENGELFVDLVNRIVKVGGLPVKLTATEYSLLIQFVKNAGKF